MKYGRRKSTIWTSLATFDATSMESLPCLEGHSWLTGKIERTMRIEKEEKEEKLEAKAEHDRDAEVEQPVEPVSDKSGKEEMTEEPSEIEESSCDDDSWALQYEAPDDEYYFSTSDCRIFERADLTDPEFYNQKRSGEVIRNKQHNKKEKISSIFVNACRHRKHQEDRLLTLEHVHARRSKAYDSPVGSTGQTTTNTTIKSRRPIAKSRTSRKEPIKYNFQTQDELQRALAESAREFAASMGLTTQQYIDLQSRDLTPEDYELLLLLDTTVKKKTVSSDVVSKFATRNIDGPEVERCTICLVDFERNETVKILPRCNHCFHADCIRQWLTTSSVNCPIDGLPVDCGC
eukprot:TRINITY_DN1808_c0_g1_i1.p1 TRINITY_DN1808_c0_g1~~TRINITY_DN1808_c0_g1_i1.p1  ORF type:complete len:347 (-),score=99.78 TRINITY_DN1808_c0_g1_i1:110-1150(-)